MDELFIIKKVLQGDVNEFAQLVNNYKNLAYTLAYNIVLNKEDAEEIIQDAFVKAYSSLNTFKGNAKFSTWLYRIVVNTALNKKRLKKITIVDVEEQDSNDVADEVSVLANYKNSEQKKFIKIAITSLNENERICITMYYLNEFSIDEINELTGISTANIKVLLHRGRKKLYEILHKLLKEEVKTLM